MARRLGVAPAASFRGYPPWRRQPAPEQRLLPCVQRRLLCGNVRPGAGRRFPTFRRGGLVARGAPEEPQRRCGRLHRRQPRDHTPFNHSLITGLIDATWPAEHAEEAAGGDWDRSTVAASFICTWLTSTSRWSSTTCTCTTCSVTRRWRCGPALRPSCPPRTPSRPGRVARRDVRRGRGDDTAFQVASDGSSGRAGRGGERRREPEVLRTAAAAPPLWLSASFPNAVSRSLMSPLEPDRSTRGRGYELRVRLSADGDRQPVPVVYANRHTLAAVELQLRAGGSFPATAPRPR